MKKDLSSPEYWDAFGRGIIYADNKPTIREAADTILDLMEKLKAERQKVDQAEHETKCAKQQFQVFVTEVWNTANKYSKL